MSHSAELLERAAESYEKAGLPADAGRCFLGAGLLLRAAKSFEEAGEMEAAAAAYRRGGAVAAAASLYVEIGRPEEAVSCHESAGDLLTAGWVLALHTSRTAQAQMLLSDVATSTPAADLRRALGLSMCTARLSGDAAELMRVVERCAIALPSIEPAQTRAELRDWAVQAADRVGRHDLAAAVYAAAYHARTPNTIARWRSWAAANLGDTFGVPDRALSD